MSNPQSQFPFFLQSFKKYKRVVFFNLYKNTAEIVTNNTFFFEVIDYRLFHGFGQAKFTYGGSILGSSQFTLLPPLPLKMMLSLKLVKIDSKISNSLR
jgi:hypothetical protein